MYLQYILPVCKHKTMVGMSMYVLTVYPPSVQAQNNGRNVMYVLAVCPLSMQAQNNGGDVHVCTYSISSQCASTKQWRGCPCMYLQYVLPVCKHKTMAGMSMYVFTVCPPSVQAQNNGRNVHVCTCSMSSQVQHKTMAEMSMYVLLVCSPSVQAQNNDGDVHVCTCSMSSQCASTKQWQKCHVCTCSMSSQVQHKTMAEMSKYVLAVCPPRCSTKQWQKCPCMYF